MVRSFIRSRVRRFFSEESGSSTIELVIVLPIMCWVYAAMLVYFDGFRYSSIAEKATYVVGDMISREQNYITPRYLSNMHQTYRFMAGSHEVPQIRVTVFYYDEANDRYRRVWSRNRGGAGNLNNNALNSEDVTEHIPLMYDGEILILTQTWTKWKPFLNFGFTEKTFEYNIVTRPRGTGNICWSTDSDNPDPTNSTCPI